MHALRHVHELLVPGGTLLDLHPVTQSQVEADGRSLGEIAEPEWLTVDLPNAEGALARMVQAGLYMLEGEVSLEVLQHFDRADELLELKADLLSSQRALRRRIAAVAGSLLTRERAILRRLRVAETCD